MGNCVWTQLNQRLRGQCTFISAQGKRCPERHGLEFHWDETPPSYDSLEPGARRHPQVVAIVGVFWWKSVAF